MGRVALERGGPVLYLPARSDLDVDGGLTVPEDGDVLLWEMNHREVSRGPNQHPPVRRTGRVLQTDIGFTVTEALAPASATSAHFHFHFLNKKRRPEVTLTGFPVSSSNAMTDWPKVTIRDFLQTTPLSKQLRFTAATLNVAPAVLCGPASRRYQQRQRETPEPRAKRTTNPQGTGPFYLHEVDFARAQVVVEQPIKGAVVPVAVGRAHGRARAKVTPEGPVLANATKTAKPQ